MQEKLKIAVPISIGAFVASMVPGSTTEPVKRFAAPRSSENSTSLHLAEPNFAAKDTVQLTPREEKGWSNTKERLFSELLILKSRKEATSEQLRKFRELQELRRYAKNPVSGDQVVLQFKKMQMAQKLIRDTEAFMTLG